MPATNLPDLHTPDDLAERYGVGVEWVQDMLRSGELRGFKLAKRWVVHTDDWNAFIDRRRASAVDADVEVS